MPLRLIIKILHRCGFKTEEPEVSRLGDCPSPPNTLWQVGDSQNPPLDWWPRLSHLRPWQTYSDRSKIKPVTTSHISTLTGFNFTTTSLRHPLHRNTRSPPSAPQGVRSLVSGRRSDISGRNLDRPSRLSFLVRFHIPSPGIDTILRLTTPTRPSGTLKPRAWFSLGVLRLYTGAEPEATFLSTKSFLLTLSQRTGR